jgi:hypothetical protein
MKLGEFQEAVLWTENGPQAGSYTWDSIAFADDDTFPEVIIDMQSLIGDDGLRMAQEVFKKGLPDLQPHIVEEYKHRYRRFRNHVSRFLNHQYHLSLRNYNKASADDGRRFLTNYFGAGRPQDVEAYENFLAGLFPTEAAHCYFNTLAYIQDQPDPVGFYLAEQTDEQSAGCYSAVTLREVKGLSEYIYLEIFRFFQQRGIRFLNIGGSEVKQLHSFKRKFVPYEERRMHMLVY